MKVRLLILLFVGVVGAGCAHDAARRCMHGSRMVECVAVPLESPERDAQAEQFAAPAAGKAHVYIVRSRVLAAQTESQISVDGKVAGHLAPMTYLLLELAPGEHIINARTDQEVDMRLPVKAGDTYFIEHDLPHFEFFRPVAGKLILLEPRSGQKAVVRSKRAQADRH